MSKDTIYRQDAVDAINELHDKPNAWLDLAVEALEKLPSAQPERKKGKWIDNTFCSECGWIHEVESGFIGSVKQFNFCPCCGADMRGDNNERNFYTRDNGGNV